MQYFKKETIIILSIVVVFLAVRVPGAHIPFHQDEYKWAYIVNTTASSEQGRVPHPPLGEFIYRNFNSLLGNGNLRWLPIIFSLFNLILLFYLVKNIFNLKTALWTSGLFAVSFFSVLASLMVDTDGAVMPFFFLLMAIAYYKFKDTAEPPWKFILLFAGAALGGFLVKVSFLLCIVVFVLDFAWEKKIFSDKVRLVKFFGWGLVAIVVLIGSLFVSRIFFPSFNIASSFQYWEHFANFGSRAWFQTLIQFIKSILYASPILLIPLLFIDKEIWKITRPFFIFIALGLFAYLIAFDFSIGALDRYLQFMVVPLCIIAGAVFAKNISGESLSLKWRWATFLSLAVSLIVFLAQFISHAVPSLYPKTEWIQRAMSLHWNFLFPFMGGSGPLPFYVSFLFIALAWLLSLLLVGLCIAKITSKRTVLIGVLILGLLYNGVFAEEYIFGKINGNTASLIRDVDEFINKNHIIPNGQVTVYNDNGGYDLVKSGKYRKRLYVDPKFDIVEKIKTLNKYKEFYSVIDIPHLDPNTLYAKYFRGCKGIYYQKSGVISANVYDCRNAPDVTI